MAIKNKSKYAILGVLTLFKGSGYDIKNFCDKTIAHFWNENYGHIYPVLAQLEEEKLVIVESIEGNKGKKVYSITKEGREEFCKWMLEPIEYQPTRSELMLKLSFGSNIANEDLVQMLETAKEKYNARIEYYNLLISQYNKVEFFKQQSQYPYWLATLRYGVISTEATIKWLNETIESVNNYKEVNKNV